jgi:hypothetical protein
LVAELGLKLMVKMYKMPLMEKELKNLEDIPAK